MTIEFNFLNSKVLVIVCTILMFSSCKTKKPVLKEMSPRVQSLGDCIVYDIDFKYRLKVDAKDSLILLKDKRIENIERAKVTYPKPIAGMDKFIDYLLEQTLMPSKFLYDSINCSLRVYALVDTDGKISMDSIQVTHFPENMINKNDSSLLDNFFISQFVYNISIVLTQLDHWKPGTVNSMPAEFLLPIDFIIYYEDN